jgi:hypothetical protein
MSQSSLTPEQVNYCDWLFGQWQARGFDEMIISLNSHLFPGSVNASQSIDDSRRAMKNYLLSKILLFFPGEWNNQKEQQG